MIYVLLALGLNIVVGYAGLLDLGYAAFFAIGAYSMGLLNSPVLGSPLYGYPWSFWICIWIAAAVSALLGVVIGAPTLRVRGDYLAIITLGFGEIIPVAIRNLGDITIDIGGWRPIVRLNLTGGENGVNPVGRPYLPGVPFETDPVPWYFLILIIGLASLWAMNRLRDSRLGRAWMAIREDETAADCTGVNPISTKLLAFALGASFSGFAGSVYAAKLQAITPGAFEFQVSIMLLCMVVLGGAGSLKGVILGGMLITLFDRVVLTQSTFMVRAIGRTLGIPALVTADLTLWRWFFFGLGLVLVMLLRPEGLAGRRVRRATAGDADTDDPVSPEPAPEVRVEAIPGWLRDGARGGGAAMTSPALLEVQGLTKRFGGVVALNAVDLVVPRGAIIGLIGPNGAGKTTFFNVVTGLIRPDGGRMLLEGTPLAGLRPNAIVARGVARTFQSIRLFPEMTVLDNVLVGEHCRLAATVAGAVLRPPAVVAEEARARARARDLLAFVGLGGKADDIARNLPYGDQRRLEIARALATEPRLLLLDEPTAGMNPRETETLTELIGLLRQELGLSVLLIEHDMAVVMGISDRITVLDYGTRIAEGTPAEIQRHPQGDRSLSGRRVRAGARRASRGVAEHARPRGRPHVLRQHPGASRCLARRGGGRDRHAHRRQRRGQDHHPQDDPRHGATASRNGQLQRPAARHAGDRPDRAARHRAVAGRPADLPADDGAREPGARRVCPHGTARRSAPTSSACSRSFRACASGPASRAGRSRAASSRCSPSAARSWRVPRFSCWTSRRWGCRPSSSTRSSGSSRTSTVRGRPSCSWSRTRGWPSARRTAAMSCRPAASCCTTRPPTFCAPSSSGRPTWGRSRRRRLDPRGQPRFDT